MGGFIRLNPPTTSTPVTLPVLTYLDICIELESLHPMNGMVLGGNNFPLLQTLNLGLFRSTITTPPNLSDSWIKLCTILGASAPRLKYLSIQSAAGRKGGASLCLPFPPLIRSCPTCVQTLELSGHHLAPFTQEDLTQVIRFIPSIMRLRYDPGSNVGLVNRSNLLVDIACTLAHIDELELLVDITHLPQISELPLPQNQITELTVLGETSPNDPVMVARCLYRLFPNLTRFHYWRESDRPISWSTVEEVLYALWGAKEEDEMRRVSRRRQATVTNLDTLGLPRPQPPGRPLPSRLPL